MCLVRGRGCSPARLAGPGLLRGMQPAGAADEMNVIDTVFFFPTGKLPVLLTPGNQRRRSSRGKDVKVRWPPMAQAVEGLTRHPSPTHRHTHDGELRGCSLLRPGRDTPITHLTHPWLDVKGHPMTQPGVGTPITPPHTHPWEEGGREAVGSLAVSSSPDGLTSAKRVPGTASAPHIAEPRPARGGALAELRPLSN